MYQILVREDCTEAMKRLPDASVHSVVCDPPYHLTSIVERFGKADAAPVIVPEGGSGVYARSSKGFMGKVWDGGDVAFRAETWREVFRVLKPGGHLLAFGGTRTYHRMACAIEDAGFEIRDSIHYTYGSGFPKSLSVPSAIDKAARGVPQGSTKGDPLKRGKGVLPPREVLSMGGNNGGATTGLTDDYEEYVPATDDAKIWKGWGTALKPAHEIIVVARKPLIGTVAANVLAHGTGAINVDGCRVKREDGDRTQYGRDKFLPHANTTPSLGAFKEVTPYALHNAGRWPANFLISHDVNCSEGEGCVPGCPVAVLDAQSGDKKASFVRNRTKGARPFNNNGQPTDYSSEKVDVEESGGGASRYFNVLPIEAEDFAPFFYTSKASRREREAGCESVATKSGAEAVGRDEGSAGMNSPRAGAGRTAKTVHNDHPTIKSLALMEWCVKLVTPPEGTVLDPFMGSGSTGIAALRNGFSFIGMEADEHYMEIAEARIRHHGGEPEVLR